MLEKNPKLAFEDFEIAYAALAEAIDAAGGKRESLFLTKLVLLLAHEHGDIIFFKNALADALQNIEN